MQGREDGGIERRRRLPEVALEDVVEAVNAGFRDGEAIAGEIPTMRGGAKVTTADPEATYDALAKYSTDKGQFDVLLEASGNERALRGAEHPAAGRLHPARDNVARFALPARSTQNGAPSDGHTSCVPPRAGRG